MVSRKRSESAVQDEHRWALPVQLTEGKYQAAGTGVFIMTGQGKG